MELRTLYATLARRAAGHPESKRTFLRASDHLFSEKRTAHGVPMALGLHGESGPSGKTLKTWPKFPAATGFHSVW